SPLTMAATVAVLRDAWIHWPSRHNRRTVSHHRQRFPGARSREIDRAPPLRLDGERRAATSWRPYQGLPPTAPPGPRDEPRQPTTLTPRRSKRASLCFARPATELPGAIYAQSNAASAKKNCMIRL